MKGLSDPQFISERTENYQAFLDSLADFPLDKVEKITGVPRDQIEKAARLFAGSKPSAIFYAMGITQHSHGTDNVMATSNLAHADRQHRQTRGRGQSAARPE